MNKQNIIIIGATSPLYHKNSNYFIITQKKLPKKNNILDVLGLSIFLNYSE